MSAVLDQTPNKAETASNLFAASAADVSPKNGPDFTSIRSKVAFNFFLLLDGLFSHHVFTI